MVSREKGIVWGTFIAAFLLWALDVVMRYQLSDWGVWLWRKELINLTGVMAFIPMGVIMILALRPKFLEGICHGLDKIYYIHKWLGIWSIVFVALHYGAKLSKGFLRQYFERGPKLGGDKFLLLEEYRGFAKIAGEWLFYLFLGMLIITLCKRIPYRFWKWIHKLISLFFVVSVFHLVVLMPARYWLEPVGIVMILLSLTGLYSAVIALFGGIGKDVQFHGEIIDLEQQDDVTLATCKVAPKRGRNWQHCAGQYAFIKHENSSEAHPFTIASEDKGDGVVRFAIKALGHYTCRIQHEWKVGDRVRIEGGYGRFFFRNDDSPKQLWIAGGVGITPFIAWLESLHGEEIGRKVSLIYCVNEESECLVPEYLAELCAKSGVVLKLHCSHREGLLDAKTLPLDLDTTVWFCGPAGFAQSIQKAIAHRGLPVNRHFHREYFDMR